MSGLRYDEGAAASPSVATEDVAGTHFQLLKLVDGTPGSVTPIGTAANPLKVSGPVTNAALSNVTGTWSYYAGVSGTVNVTAGQRVIGIAAHSTVGGTLTINGGQTITVPANSGIAIAPQGNVTAPAIVFGTDSYFVETVS